uniref:Palmitoyltransferase n=1 Tax=Prymnesium polylepis TaxID=72548 RepID=A0A7S4MDC9_9EUKA
MIVSLLRLLISFVVEAFDAVAVLGYGIWNFYYELNHKGRAVDNKSAFLWAASMGDIKMVRHLLRKGMDVNVFGSPPGYTHTPLTALHAAAMCAHLEIAVLLVTNGAHVNARTPVLGYTPLMQVGSILEPGTADEAVPDKRERRRLLARARENSGPLTTYLLDAGADPSIASDHKSDFFRRGHCDARFYFEQHQNDAAINALDKWEILPWAEREARREVATKKAAAMKKKASEKETAGKLAILLSTIFAASVRYYGVSSASLFVGLTCSGVFEMFKMYIRS